MNTEDSHEYFRTLLDKGDQKTPTPDSGKPSASALAVKSGDLANAPSLNVADLLKDAPSVGALGRWRLGATFSEAERTQLKSVLDTRGRILRDKLDILEKQSKLFRDNFIASLVENTLLQAESELTRIRKERDDERNRRIDQLYLQFVDEITEVQNNPSLPTPLKEMRAQELKEDFMKSVADLRSGAILKQHGLQ